MFKNVKEGDKVYSILYGWGQVDAVRHYRCGLVCDFWVRFRDDKRVRFNANGKMCETDTNPTLFWGEVKIDPPKVSRPFKLQNEKKNKINKRNFIQLKMNCLLCQHRVTDDPVCFHPDLGGEEQCRHIDTFDFAIPEWCPGFELAEALKRFLVKH